MPSPDGPQWQDAQVDTSTELWTAPLPEESRAYSPRLRLCTILAFQWSTKGSPRKNPPDLPVLAGVRLPSRCSLS